MAKYTMHGYCIGMGMSLAIHCDLRLAASNTIIGYPEVKHGMISAVSAIQLPEIVARAKAMELREKPHSGPQEAH